MKVKLAESSPFNDKSLILFIFGVITYVFSKKPTATNTAPVETRYSFPKNAQKAARAAV